jgi:hypothetical protein
VACRGETVRDFASRLLKPIVEMKFSIKIFAHRGHFHCTYVGIREKVHEPMNFKI